MRARDNECEGSELYFRAPARFMRLKTDEKDNKKTEALRWGKRCGQCKASGYMYVYSKFFDISGLQNIPAMCGSTVRNMAYCFTGNQL